MPAARLNPVPRAMWKPRAFQEATATVDGRVVPLVAPEFKEAERDAVFDPFVRLDPVYGAYRDQTARRMPVFELRPRSA